MTSLGEKAEETPDVRLIGDAQYSAYRLTSTDLVPADDLTEEGEFPKFGDYLATELPGSGSAMYVECPQGLAAALVDLGVEEGDEFRIERATKQDGAWSVEVEPGDE